MPAMLTDDQFRALTAICDTLVPSLEPPPEASPEEAEFWRLSASALDVPRQIVHSLAEQPADKRQKLILILNMLSKSSLAGLLTGSFQPYDELPVEARERILQRWATSSFPELRQGFQAFKRLTHGLVYSLVNENGSNPTWPAIQYDSLAALNGASPVMLQPKNFSGPATLECDVVIIGSGAGGGVVAGELARSGLQVIVLEKGGFHPPSHAQSREFDSFRDMYEQSGMLTTEDLGVSVLAGASLGGGTTINWSASFSPPQSLLAEWEQDHGLEGLTGSEFAGHIRAVCDRLGVNTDVSQHSRQTDALLRGCRSLGYVHDIIPRNVTGCAQDECGWCGFGCPTGGKNSVLKTYLADAAEAGAEIVVGCFVERVLIENGTAVGAAGWVTDSQGNQHPLTVRARLVVVAAGALHTPALLLRSGLQNPNIGQHLRIHPTTAARGEYGEKLEMWRGPILTGYSNHFSDQDGSGYGVTIEVPSAHSGLWASVVPWHSGRQHKKTMLRTAYQAGFIVITRDVGSGQVLVDAEGLPRLHYRLHPIDAKHMLVGLVGALRIHVAAGAREVGIAHTDVPAFDLTSGGKEDFEAYLREVETASRAVNRLGLFSAHQMGSARMGEQEADSVVRPDGECWEARNLYIADASVFPTASGVNPMITIMALARRTAHVIKARLSS